MSAVEKAAEVLAAHADDGCGDCICSEYVLDDTLAAHVAQALAGAGLLIAAFPDGTAGTLTGDLLTDMAAYARRLKDRAEAAERALATLREDVAREIEAGISGLGVQNNLLTRDHAARIARGPR